MVSGSLKVRLLTVARSQAYESWSTQRARELDRMENVHREITGSGRGRRWDSEHLNCAIISRLVSEFQGFARDLFNDSIDHLVGTQNIADPGIAAVMRGAFVNGCGLNKSNPTWSVIAADYAKFGIDLKAAVDAR